jgi:hypothetical protein
MKYYSCPLTIDSLTREISIPLYRDFPGLVYEEIQPDETRKNQSIGM